MQQELQTAALTEATNLPANRRIIWDWLGDFTFLSIMSTTAFCAFAWMKQVQFPNLVRADAERGLTTTTGHFAPRGLWLSVGILALGLLIGSAGQAAGYIGVALALAAGTLLLLNLAYWLAYTSAVPRLQRLVPKAWLSAKPRSMGYMR